MYQPNSEFEPNLDVTNEREMEEMIRMERYITEKERIREREIDRALSNIEMLRLELNQINNVFDETDLKNTKKLNSLSLILRKKKEEIEKKKSKYEKIIKAKKMKDKYNEIYTKSEKMTFELNYCRTPTEVMELREKIITLLNEMDNMRIQIYGLEREIEEI